MDNLDLLTARVARHVEAAHIPALAFGIVHNGELIHTAGFGCDQDTQFPSCSTAKPITAMAVMRLVEDGRLDLDRPVAQVPNSNVTLRRLLSHTSGLGPDPDVPPRFFTDATALRDHVIQDIPSYAAVPAGDVFWYSNPGFNLAGHLAAEHAGRAYPTLVEELVLRPLGMSSTTFQPGGGGNRPPIAYPAGGAVTTVRDLSKLAACLLNEGSPVLAPSTVNLMQTVHADAYTRAPRRYGLGLVIGQHRGRKLVSHGGGGFGCGSTFVLLPEQQIAVTVLFNHPAGYAVDILDDLLDESSQGDPRPPVGEFTTGTFRSPAPDLHPREITVAAESDAPVLVLDGQRLPLQLVDDAVFATPDDRISVGFVPGQEYVMLDAHGLGLPSAVPYRRQTPPPCLDHPVAMDRVAPLAEHDVAR